MSVPVFCCTVIVDDTIVLVSITVVGVEELFNLETDPGELRNVLDAHPAVAAELAAELDRWQQEHRRSQPVREELSEEDKARLRSLGYVE